MLLITFQGEQRFLHCLGFLEILNDTLEVASQVDCQTRRLTAF